MKTENSCGFRNSNQILNKNDNKISLVVKDIEKVNILAINNKNKLKIRTYFENLNTKKQ